MVAIGKFLYNIICSDVYKKKEWQSWADNLILKYDELELWIYDLAVAATKEEVFSLLADRMIDEMMEVEKISHVSTDVIQGYYYHKHTLKEITLYQLLEYSGIVADAGDDSVDCEYFYEKLNEIDNCPSIINNADFLKEIYEYFEPRKKWALEEKEIVENIDKYDWRF